MTIELKKLFEVDNALNERMVDTILRAIKDKHEVGMDYIKFKQSIQNLMAMNMDEVTSVKSAFATASTMGLDKDALIKSIFAYQGVIDNERDKFIDSLKNQIKAKIEEPEAQIVQLDKTIVDHQQKIEALQREIAIIESNKETIKADVVQQKEKIESIRKEFLVVYEAFSKNLADDKSHFETLL